jgi:hypothetical protein
VPTATDFAQALGRAFRTTVLRAIWLGFQVMF